MEDEKVKRQEEVEKLRLERKRKEEERKKIEEEKEVYLDFSSRLTRRVPLVEQELLTLLEHLSSSPVFTVTPSLVYVYVL